MLNYRDKNWGQTTCLSNNDNMSVWYAKIEGSSCSSLHFHPTEINEIFVLSGKVNIYQRYFDIDADLEMESVTELRADDFIILFPKIWHRFEAIENSTIIETYKGIEACSGFYKIARFNKNIGLDVNKYLEFEKIMC